MKIMSFNVRVWTRDTGRNTGNWKTRMKAINLTIRRYNPDVICFQELSFPANFYVPKGYRRVGLTVSHPIYVKEGIKTSNHSFHIHYDSVMIDDITLLNVHGRWESEIVDKIAAQILPMTKTGNKVIACGDFNVGSADLISRGFPNTVRMELGLPHEWTFMHFTKPPIPDVDSEIDHCFMWNFPKYAKNYEILDDTYEGVFRMSDHKPILIEI